MTTRLNARLNEDLARKLAWLRERTGRSTTEIVRRSLEAYYEQARQSAEPAELLGEFVGCAEGPPGLSEDYKAELSRSLGQKARAR